MDGCTVTLVGEWMGVHLRCWRNGWLHSDIDGGMDECTFVLVDEWMDGCAVTLDKNGSVDWWRNGRVYRNTGKNILIDVQYR